MLAKNSYVKKFLYHFISWTVFIFYQIISNYDYYVPEYGEGFLILKQCTSCLIVISIFYLNYFLLTPFTLIIKRKRFYFFLGAILLIAIYFILFIFQGKMLDNFLGKNIFYLKRINNLHYEFFIPVLFILVSTGIRLGQEYFLDRYNKIELEKQVAAAELQLLKSQINPHFLFNSLNSIYALSQKKSDKTPDAILKLSEIMRYILYEALHEKVMISQEINFLNSFISLQQLRMVNPKMIKTDISSQDPSCSISPLLLIPFLENSFKHADLSKEENPIEIYLLQINNKLTFKVINQIGNVQKDVTSGIGLANLQKRLSILYKSRHKLNISSENGKFIAELELTIE